MANSVVVQVPAFREPAIAETLDGIAAQKHPDTLDTDADVSIHLQAWVTPATADPMDDTTFAAAAAHDVAIVFEAPRGKLAARNAAHDHAVQDGADVVVVWDADVMPRHDGVLAALLAPLEDGDGKAVAVNGSPRGRLTTPIGAAATLRAALEERVRPHLNGQLSAITAEGWAGAGPFETALDQTDIYAVRQEEEFAFYQRLTAIGAVPKATDAVVLEDPRRAMWHFNRAFDRFGHYPMGEWGRRRGTETFMPRNRRGR